MRQFLLPLTSAVFALLIGASVASATCCAKSGFSVPLGDEWRQIPEATLINFAKKVSATRPGLPMQSYAYAFQLKDPSNGDAPDFSYPYIMVQIMNTGRATDELLRSLKTFSPKERRQVGRAFEKDFPSSLSKMKYSQPTYDKEAKIVWSKILSKVEGVGEVVGLTGSVLTSQGAINFHCYTRLENFYQNVEKLERFVRGVKLVPPLEF